MPAGADIQELAKAATPVPVSYTQDIKAQGTNHNRTAVLLDIKTKIYGLKADGKDFPTCSLQTIATNHSDASCPADIDAKPLYYVHCHESPIGTSAGKGYRDADDKAGMSY